MSIDYEEFDSSTFLRLFRGREDYIAQQGKDYYHPIEKSLNEYYLARHYHGDVTFGIYLLTKESLCHLLCLDIDIPKAEIDSINVSDSTEKYIRLSSKLQSLMDVLVKEYGLSQDSLLLEDTGGRGYHIWIFLSQAILGTTAVAFGDSIKKKVEFEFEFFPKQGRLTPKRKFGNLIKLPLGTHQKYKEKSKFFTLVEGQPHFFDNLSANLELLNRVIPVDSLVVSDIAEPLQGEILLGDELLGDPIREQRRYHYSGEPSILLSHCAAMKQLSEKAEAGKSLDRMEAFHYSTVMLSVAGGVNEIHRVMKLAYTHAYTPEKTNSEIEQILPLRPTSCKLLLEKSICPRYCKESVKKQNEDPLTPNTTPCSVWLKRDKSHFVEMPQDPLEVIGAKDNIELAFHKLKRYYYEEVTIIFDPFDFSLFERKLNEYIQVFSEALTQRIVLPFAGYQPFYLPKKLDDKLELQYRRMAYSSIYDQVPVQAVFNIFGPIIDSTFHKSSYGYRWNKDGTLHHMIFEDWRESYPRFRDDILNSLKDNPKGFHICCDLKGYYDNVDHQILLQQLRNNINDEYIFKYVEKLVLSYEFIQGTHRGIPQGPAYARLLANLYLNDFDAYFSRFTAGYFRYVDDFVLVFDSLKSAESGLVRITEQLTKLGLELSQDGDKKPTILPNTNLIKVRDTLDKIRYGILENTKHIQRLDVDTINEFYNAVERHSVSFDNPDQLIKINAILPSLLYIVTQETLIPHPLRLKLVAIIDYLIRKHWFFPKRLSSVFERLLDLDGDKQKYVELFDFLEPSHKCYLLLTIFNRLHNNKEYHNLLVSILKKSIVDSDVFVRGFSIAIMNRTGLEKELGIVSNSILDSLLLSTGWFDTVRYVGETDYLSLTWEEKAKFRNLINSTSPDLAKTLLLENLGGIPTIHIDEIYLKQFVSDFRVTSLPAVCSLLGVINNRSQFTDSMINFLTLDPKFKAISIIFISLELSKRCSSVGLAEIENLQIVYEDIGDPELKRAIFRVLHQNTELYEEEVYRTHRLISNENRCLYFEHIENQNTYSHWELIPEEIFQEQLNLDVSSAKTVVENLSQSTAIPPVEFYYNSAKREINLRYKCAKRLEVLAKSEFNISEKQAVVKVLKLASDAYKKAVFVRRVLGKSPLISTDNILVNTSRDMVVLRSIGSSLKTPLIHLGVTLGDGDADIPYMIAILIRDLLFDSENSFISFKQTNPKEPLHAFIVQIIQNMSGKEPSHRYSSLRFEYLVEIVERVTGLSDKHLGVFYLRERLRSALFRHNQNKATWHGVCSALDEHATHILDICPQKLIQNLKIKNRFLATILARQKPHFISRHLLNIALNRKIIEQSTIDEPSYANLTEYLLMFSALCMEITSLCRSLYDRNSPERDRLINVITSDWIIIRAAQYEVELNKADLIEALLYNPDETGIDMREISLKNIALLTLLSMGSSFLDGKLITSRPKGISKSRFDEFVHTCLYRIPRLESELQELVERLSETLRHNDEPAITIDLSVVRESINIVIKNFCEVSRKIGIARHFGHADGKQFPENIICTSPFHRKRFAELNTLPGTKLTNSFPSSRFECSWDIRQGNITNLLIPSVGLNTLFSSLIKGKLFGYKLSYLYTGKMMIGWDSLVLICTILIASLCKYGETTLSNSYSQALSSIFATIFIDISAILVLKLIYDLAFWVPPLSKIIATVREAWDQYQQGKDSS